MLKPYETYAELFAGVGGWGACLPATLRPIFAIEKDPHIASWYVRNHTLHAPKMFHMDIQQANLHDLPQTTIDILFASPPCQSYSTARTKLTGRNDQDLGLQIVRFVKYLEPRLILIENVPNYLNFSTAQRLIAQLRALDYNVTSQVVDAYDYGIPQDRRRAIIAASREFDPIITVPSHPIREGWYPTLDPLTHYEPSNWIESLHKHVPTTDHRKLFDWLVTNYHKWTHKLSGKWRYTLPMDRDEYQAFLLPTGNTARDITWRANFHPATTITARCGAHHYRVIDRTYQDIMQLSIDALARLQTFPDNWQWPATRSFAGHLIGNAVPPQLSLQLVRNLAAERQETKGVCHTPLAVSAPFVT